MKTAATAFAIAAMLLTGAPFAASRVAPRWALGIRIYTDTATTEVALHAGRRAFYAQLDPGHIHWFPFRQDGVQRLSAIQSTDPGTLRATVSINFAAPHGVPHCSAYAPPRFTVQEWPR